MLIAVGLGLSLLAYGLRQARLRRWLAQNLVAGLLVCVATLAILEVALTVLEFSTYYPMELPTEYQDFLPWRTCDEAGCHFIRDVALANCEEGSVSRTCALNPQGFSDTQPFFADEDYALRDRILILGDSFTFGMTADVGSSYVEILESSAPESIVWNTAIPGAGTHHALKNFETYAPLLQPQVTILGFYMNDFENNMLSLSDWFASEDPTDETVVVWRDLWGNAIQLDQRSAFYYRQAGVDPPANKIERFVGTTRLGTLALQFIDAIGRIKNDVGGMSSLSVTITREYLHRLRDAAVAEDTALLVLLIPRQGDIGRPSALFKNAIQLLEELQIDYLNPVNALDAKLDYAPDEHWNNAGHQKIALLLRSCLGGFQANSNFRDCIR
ncbi:MAG: hypothetical protein OXG78_01730 [Chloroflexi bacterium]|nr:hypothetical protein [Chloroflexota bacterium]